MAVIEAIATTYLEADAASVTFSSIPQTYEHLQLRVSVRSNAAANSWARLYVQLGDGSVDTGSNYSHHSMMGDTSSTSVNYGSGEVNVDYKQMVDTVGGSPSTGYGNIVLDLMDYVNTNKNTTMAGVFGTASSDSPVVGFGSGLWDNTAAVDTIKLAPSAGSFSRGSEFTLYGLNSA